MAEGDSPTVARRRVRLAIREAREANNLTQQQVAEQMEWSLSKVIRIESGEVSISVNDLRPLLAFVGIKDRSEVSSLLADARIARTRQRQAWYQRPEFRDHMSDAFRRLIEYEAEASAIRSYSVYYPPGPLQIPAYAAALTGSWGDHDLPSEAVEAVVEARRIRRDTVVKRIGSFKFFVILDQSVLMRTIGGPAVLVEQLKDLHGLASRGLLHIRMLSFDLDSPIANNASFDLLTVPGGAGEVMYRENGLADEIVEDAASTARHRERFDQLWHVADAEADTIDFIKGRIEFLETKITESQSRT
jgi:transcriptional regulator with XRE-family HTH domain